MLRCRFPLDKAGERASEHQRLAATRRWLDTIVLGEKLCPFAPPVKDTLRLRASRATTEEETLQELSEEAAILRAGMDAQERANEMQPETSLLVLSGLCLTHEKNSTALMSWRQLIALSWKLQTDVLCEMGHSDTLQIVLFHPSATHSTFVDPQAPPDAGDYTIRAPFPVVQLLREKDILRGVRSFPDAAGIPGRNRTRFRDQGAVACARRLEECHDRRDSRRRPG